MARPTLLRPLKTLAPNVRTYAEQVAYVGRDKTPVLAPEVDADFKTIFDAWNDPAASFVPQGPAGGDFVGSSFPDLVIANGAVTRAKVAPELWLPPIPTSPGDIGAVLRVDPGPILAWQPASLPPPPSAANVGQVLGVEMGPTGLTLAWTEPSGGGGGGAVVPPPTSANIGQVLGVEIGTGGLPAPAWQAPSGGGDLWQIVSGTLFPGSGPTSVAGPPVARTAVKVRLFSSPAYDWHYLTCNAAPSHVNGNQFFQKDDAGMQAELIKFDPYGGRLVIQAISNLSPDNPSDGAYFLPTGDFQITGSNGWKYTGTTWINPSDPRLKRDVGPYARGLADLVQLEPITYHMRATPDGPLCYGLDASQVQPIFPECVGTMPAHPAPGEPAPDPPMLSLDMSPILFAFINAIKELARRVTALEQEVVRVHST